VPFFGAQIDVMFNFIVFVAFMGVFGTQPDVISYFILGGALADALLIRRDCQVSS